MAEVWLVEDGTGKRYALKRLKIPPNLDPEEEMLLRTAFHREAEMLCLLSHPHIVRGIAYWINLNEQELAMEFLEGRTADKASPLPTDEAIHVITQIADALHYLHQRRIIHRDVKPSNIFLCDDGTAKLLDLGILKGVKRARKAIGDVEHFGSPGYAPPEQYDGYTDERSDIYALGATLYTLLTGQIPPEAPERQRGVPLLMPPSVSPRLQAVIEQAMSLAPEKRFPTVLEFMDALV